MSQELSFFDVFSLFKYTILYGPTDNVDVMFIFTTTAERDASGAINLQSDMSVDMVTTFSLETHIHF